MNEDFSYYRDAALYANKIKNKATAEKQIVQAEGETETPASDEAEQKPIEKKKRGNSC